MTTAKKTPAKKAAAPKAEAESKKDEAKQDDVEHVDTTPTTDNDSEKNDAAESNEAPSAEKTDDSVPGSSDDPDLSGLAGHAENLAKWENSKEGEAFIKAHDGQKVAPTNLDGDPPKGV